MNRRFLLPVAVSALAGLALAACGDDGDSGATTAAPTTAAPTTAASRVIDPAACAVGKTLSAGTLTVATGNPAFSPWVIDDAPESAKGFEAAVAYAIAEKMGFTGDAVKWVRTGFDEVIAPGPKTFDFNLQQYTITETRSKVVTFSVPYYITNQALVTFADSPFATATKVSDLKDAKLGAAVGTTSLDFINDVIQPNDEAAVFDDNTGAKSALEAKQIDGIIVDLPTSGGIAYGELTNGTVVGQFVRQGDEKGDELALLFEKDNPLADCASAAITLLTEEGTLAALEETWLKGTDGIPVISRD